MVDGDGVAMDMAILMADMDILFLYMVDIRHISHRPISTTVDTTYMVA